MKVITDRTKIYVNRNIATQGIEVFMIKEDRDGRNYVTFEYKLEPIDNTHETHSHLPSLFFTYDEADELMTELWNAGIRPANGTGAGAHVDALKDHLKDLRKITFNKLKIE